MRMCTVPVMVLWGLVVWPLHVWSQEVVTDQVTLTSARGKLYGITSGEGIASKVLTSGEDVLVVESKGVTGYVQTTARLLGFSGRLQRWVDMNLSSAEEVITATVTPQMIIVQGQQAAYGFQSDLGRWKREPWGAGEVLVKRIVNDYVAVLITNRRALGFSALTGGFFPQDLPSGNAIDQTEANANIVIIHLSGLVLVFRSGLAIWTVLP
ncbi:hypothetical protein ACTRXD_21230 [Nitrospira sp. T9]|uniref:hypothetical protein n=1 Tax=unclassified Nitrospira TaxID=2652172 RepID=UPI003F9AA549